MFLSRPSSMFFKISTKLTLAYSLVLILSSTIIFTTLYFGIRDTFVTQEKVLLNSQLEDLRAYITLYGEQKFSEYYAKIMALKETSDSLVMLISAEGETIYLVEPINATWQADLSQLKNTALNQKTAQFTFVAPESSNSESLIVAGGLTSTNSILVLAKNVESFSAPLNKLLKMFWWMIIPVVIIGFLGGLVLSDRTLRPIRDLTNSMRKIEKGSLSTRVHIDNSGDEFEELKILCNRMLDKIETLINGLKEAFDHLAHDIRTPVTRLRGRAEIALSSEGDIESYREALQSCFENSDKILHFLQILTDITEAENRSRRLKLEKKYISDLVREMMDLYEMSFEEKSIQVRQKLDDNDWAMVDARLVTRVIANLLDNAHKYTSAGGEVMLETINQTENVILRVTDTGPGISGDEHAMIWQKLYRSDKSRSEYGMGLGLTFVKAVVEAHDGKVSVRSPVKDGRGTQFEIIFQKMS